MTSSTEPNVPNDPQQGTQETETKAPSGPVDPQTGEPLEQWDSQPAKTEQADKPATKATKK